MKLSYQTNMGLLYNEKIEDFFNSDEYSELKGKVQLVITSPPFPLNKKKEYGNLQGDDFIVWLSSLANQLGELLTEDGSIVIEMGNGWEPQSPTFSTLPLESLLSFKKNGNFHLCQEFIAYNPTRLPSPAQWVTIERIRTIDSYTRLWWLSKTERPKADNKKVLRPYSKSMEKLLKRGTYNSGKRPSNHTIGEKSFSVNNGGSIMQNVIQIDNINNSAETRMPENIFSISNAKSNTRFLKRCKELGIMPHPARMPIELVDFFVEFLTDEGDVVFDPFAGSNTTGYVAEKKGRKWVTVEVMSRYAEQSKIRFEEFENGKIES